MEIIYGVSMFILIITLLVMIILFAKNLLIPSGDIEINAEMEFSVLNKKCGFSFALKS